MRSRTFYRADYSKKNFKLLSQTEKKDLKRGQLIVLFIQFLTCIYLKENDQKRTLSIPFSPPIGVHQKGGENFPWHTKCERGLKNTPQGIYSFINLLW